MYDSGNRTPPDFSACFTPEARMHAPFCNFNEPNSEHDL